MDRANNCPRTSAWVAKIAASYLASKGVPKRVKSVMASDLRQRAKNANYRQRSKKRD
jgi:hypothetical protein